MEEDWGSNANSESFDLFGAKSTPEEQAKLDTFVSPIVYNRWSKAERRLYQRLKAQAIYEKVKNRELETLTDLTKAMESLSFFRSQIGGPDTELDDLISKVQTMKLNKEAQESS